jgi:hypothetical protein
MIPYTLGLSTGYVYLFLLINSTETVQNELDRQGTFNAPELVLANI